MSDSSRLPDARDGALYSPLLEAAVRLAAVAHHGQMRRRGPSSEGLHEAGGSLCESYVPYVTHLMGATFILARLGAADEVLAAAMLHDYLEDVPDPQGQRTIRETAGPVVLRLVLAVTEDKRAGLDARATWEVRKAEQVAAIAHMPADAVLIKAADLLHNLVSLVVDLRSAQDVEEVWARFNAPPEREVWYFRSVLEAVRDRHGAHPLIPDLEDALGEVCRFLPAKEPAGSRAV